MINLTKRLYMSLVLVIVSISLMVTVSFAWFSLSSSPVISNIKVAIGGDNTIKIAPNIVENKDGIVVNYPGFFDKASNLAIDSKILLSPVSTADGINWFVPKEYIETENKEILSVEDFELDKEFKYANTSEGGYAYLDFWIVSPLDDCYLRICTGKNYDEKSNKEDEVGSYVVQLPSQVKNYTNETGYNLDDSFNSLSSSLRVGFLVNDATVTDDIVMKSYVDSTGYINDYKSLKGLYDVNSSYNFTIYEPNGLTHSSDGRVVTLTKDGAQSITCNDGEYHITQPIGIDEQGNVTLQNIADRLIVQSESRWKSTLNSLMIDDMYQAFLKSNTKDKSIDSFYNNYLKSTYTQYVETGYMFKDTWELYSSGDSDVKSADDLRSLEMTNAIMSSNIVVLEKNVPQRIRMFVWIEGQDIDSNFLAADKTVSLRLELSGSTGS